jgi:hypothetical protein
MERYLELREKYERTFGESFSSFKYGNDIDVCVEVLERCIKTRKPDGENPEETIY